MSDAPDISSEIERKATETLLEWTDSFVSKRCSRSEVSAALSALWGSVAGLVSRELMDQINSVRTHLDSISDHSRRVRAFEVKDKVFILTMPELFKEDASIVEIGRTGIRTKKISADDETIPEISEKLEMIIDRMEGTHRELFR